MCNWYTPAQTVVGTIPRDHVTDYEWLTRNVGQGGTQETRYCVLFKSN
jgi:hypothetical protein